MLDAMGQAALVRDGQVSRAELLEAAICRAESYGESLNAIAYAGFEEARARVASCSDGPLQGVPFLMKDLTPYPGIRCTMGARVFRDYVPPEGSPYTSALDASGLVVLGTSTSSEFGLLGSTETMLHGTTRNPWRLDLSAGGSSGGAAAAVASRLVPCAHASDGGGSIRIPAALNGVFGLKPSAGRVLPSGPEALGGLIAEHCVSWSVRDSAMLLSLTERQDGPLAPVGFVQAPQRRRLRIGVYTSTLMGAAPDSEVQRALEATVTLCRDLGHDVVEMSAPNVSGADVSRSFFIVAGATLFGIEQMMLPMLGRALNDADIEPFTLSLLEWFKSLPAEALPQAMAQMGEIKAAVIDQLSPFDAVLSPTVPIRVPKLGHLSPLLDREGLIARTEELAGYTPIHNIAGLPAMSVPLHVDSEGLPIGMHFAGSLGSEATLLSLAYELEEALPWRHRLPKVPYSSVSAGGSSTGGSAV